MILEHKHKELLAFFYALLEEASVDSLMEFAELLALLDADKEEIRQIKVKNEGLKEALKAIVCNKKIKRALKEDEEPDNVYQYMKDATEAASKNAKDFFAGLTNNKDSWQLKNSHEGVLDIIAARKLFKEDSRINPSIEGIYKFNFHCFYRKEQQSLEISIETMFAVKEDEIRNVDSQNMVIFDELVAALGFSAADAEKNVSFNATLSDGNIFYDQTCNIGWNKKIKL